MKLLMTFALLLISSGSLFAESIAGFWQSIDEKTKRPQSMVAVYEYEGVYYGRMVATYDKEGKIEETIYHPKTRAPGVQGEPYYCGLDFIWGLKPNGDRFKGKIMDPKEGKVYRAALWVQDGQLVVRGELFVFGRSQRWLAVPESTFSSSFKKPNVDDFVPKIPQVK